MGFTRWQPDDWTSFSSSTRNRTVDQNFTARSAKKDMDPINVTVRESRDSPNNPNATPIIVALDVTGSMGHISNYMAQTGLGVLMEEIIARKPVPDPQVLFMGVGDAHYDRYPLQVTQFEPDIKAAEQLKNIYIEHGGGGNNSESYHLPWYFAAMKTQTDAVEKGRRKGLLFTIGDEEAPPALTKAQIKQVLGDDVARDLSTQELLAMVEKSYDVFHVVVEEGYHASMCRSRVFNSWNGVLGQARVLPLADHTKLSEVIVSAIEVHEGRNAPDVAKSWSGDTSLVVANAVRNMTAKGGSLRRTEPDNGKGLVRF